MDEVERVAADELLTSVPESGLDRGVDVRDRTGLVE